jgi:hypothetical protein
MVVMIVNQVNLHQEQLEGINKLKLSHLSTFRKSTFKKGGAKL